MFDINMLRRRPTINPSTGYSIYDTFMDKVLPGIRAARASNRRYSEGLTDSERQFQMDEAQKQRDFTLERDRLQEIAAINRARMQNQMEQNQPMNVVFDRFNELSARDKADLARKDIELGIRQMEVGRKSEWDQVREELDRMRIEQTGEKNKDAAEIARERNRILRFKNENPNLVFKDFEGDIWAIHPQTGEKLVRIGKSNVLSDEDTLRLQSGLRMGEIEARHQNRMKEIAATGEERRRTILGTRETTPMEHYRSMLNRAQELLLTRPELADHLSIENGQIIADESVPPGVIQSITGGSRSGDIRLGSGGGDSGIKTGTTDRIKVQNPDGKVGTVPLARLQEYLTNGYKVIP